MNVAIPIFQGNIAPRFGFASQFLFATVENRHVKTRAFIYLEHPDFLRRLEEIQSHGVHTLLCGGFNRRYLPIANKMGLTVISGLYGEGEAVLNAYAAGAPLPRHFRRCEGNGNGHRHRPSQSEMAHCHGASRFRPSKRDA